MERRELYFSAVTIKATLLIRVTTCTTAEILLSVAAGIRAVTRGAGGPSRPAAHSIQTKDS